MRLLSTLRLRYLNRIVRCHPPTQVCHAGHARSSHPNTPAALTDPVTRSGTAMSGCHRHRPPVSRTPGGQASKREDPPLAPRHRRRFHRLATVSPTVPSRTTTEYTVSRQPMSSQLFSKPAARSLSTEPYRRPVDKCCPRRPAHHGELLERWAPSTLRSRVSPCTAGSLSSIRPRGIYIKLSHLVAGYTAYLRATLYLAAV